MPLEKQTKAICDNEDEPLANTVRKRGASSQEDASSKRVCVSPASGMSNVKQASLPKNESTPSQPSTERYSTRPSNRGVTREAINDSLVCATKQQRARLANGMMQNYMDRRGILDQSDDDAKISYDPYCRFNTESCLSSCSKRWYSERLIGAVIDQLASMQTPTAALNSLAKSTTKSSVLSTPSRSVTRSWLSSPATTQTSFSAEPTPTYVTGESRDSIPLQRSQEIADPRRSTPSQKLTTSHGEPEFCVEYRLGSPFGAKYTGTFNDALFDTVAADLNLDNEDVSKICITLQNAPANLPDEFRTCIFHRQEAMLMTLRLDDMNDHAARKMALMEVKREEGATMVYVVEDVPPIVRSAAVF